MNDTTYFTLKSSDMHDLAIDTLSRLPLHDRGGRVEVADILNVVVFAAAWRISVNQACQELQGAPSGATVLGELARQLSDLDQLETDLNQRLGELVPRRVGAKGRRVAITPLGNQPHRLMRQKDRLKQLQSEPLLQGLILLEGQ